MPSLANLRFDDSLLSILAWVCIIHGIAWAVFQSMPLREWRDRRALADAPRQRSIQILRSEIITGREVFPEQKPTPLRAGAVLRFEDIAARITDLRELQRVPWRTRAGRELLGCAFCQHAWAALACAVASGHGWCSLLDAAGYAAGSVALFTWIEARGRCGK